MALLLQVQILLLSLLCLSFTNGFVHHTTPATSLHRHGDFLHKRPYQTISKRKVTHIQHYNCNTVGHFSNTNFRTRPSHRLHMTVFDVAFNAYSESLQHHPFITKATTGLVLCGIADIIAQVRGTIELNKDVMNMDMNLSMDMNTSFRFYVNTIDKKRLIRFASKGFFSAIIWGSWYDLSAEIISIDNIISLSSSFGLDESLAENNFCMALIRTASFMIVEQFVACPIIFGMWEIPAATILNNAPLSRIPYEVQDKLKGMLIANAKVWSLANLIIYNVPVQYRVGLSSVMDIIWQTIVSDIAAQCGTITINDDMTRRNDKRNSNHVDDNTIVLTPKTDKTVIQVKVLEEVS